MSKKIINGKKMYELVSKVEDIAQQNTIDIANVEKIYADIRKKLDPLFSKIIKLENDINKRVTDITKKLTYMENELSI